VKEIRLKAERKGVVKSRVGSSSSMRAMTVWYAGVRRRRFEIRGGV
jgi:hypothetical protein